VKRLELRKTRWRKSGFDRQGELMQDEMLT